MMTYLWTLCSMIALLVVSCKKEEPAVDIQRSTTYIQYQRLGNGFRDLQREFTLTDYVFDQEPERSEWSLDTNLNYVDRSKIAALVWTGTVTATTGHSSVLLPTGYHLLDDGVSNPVGFWLNATDKPLIWFNSNYPYSKSEVPPNTGPPKD